MKKQKKMNCFDCNAEMSPIPDSKRNYCNMCNAIKGGNIFDVLVEMRKENIKRYSELTEKLESIRRTHGKLLRDRNN